VGVFSLVQHQTDNHTVVALALANLLTAG